MPLISMTPMNIDATNSFVGSLAPANIIGIDEVGRGCLAGPVSACAYLFSHGPADLPTLRDSKLLSAAQRLALEPKLLAAGTHGYGEASSEEVDQLGINAANFLAMRRALEALQIAPLAGYRIIVDGNQIPDLGQHAADSVICLEKADAKIPAVSAASILAKIRRDRLMEAAAVSYPGYGFERHAGYGVKAHLKALEDLGPCPLHRMSFRPLKATQPKLPPAR